MIWLLFAAPLAYQAIAVFACLRFSFQRDGEPSSLPAVSLLKPVRGCDPGFYEAIRSHAGLDYPEFELLFAIPSADDAARASVERLMREFPKVSIRLITRTTDAPNGKVGSLIDLEREARHELLVVNDGDIRVSRDYLRRLVAPLARERVGLVTCLYRPRGHSLAGWFEAVGVATDFVPSVLVSRCIGIAEFGLGSTLAFRRSDLRRIGGFQAIAEFLADDYQLGNLLSSSGRRIHLSREIVATSLPAGSLRDAWRHQLRWARTVRVSRDGLIGYLGLPVTFATVWALVAALLGVWPAAAALLAARMAMALAAAGVVLKEPRAALYALFTPPRDLWGAAVWFAGLFGDTVEWSGLTLRLRKDGRIADNQAD